MRSKNFLIILIVALAGGSIPVFAKLALRDFEPFTLIFFRFLAASIVIYFFLPKEDLSLSKMNRLKWVAFVGTLNPIFIFLALQHLPANVIALFYAAVPGLSVVYLWITKKAHESMKQFVGFILGMTGVLVISQQTIHDKSSGDPKLGLIFITIAVVGFFAYGIMSKELQRNENISGAALAFYFSVFTAVMALPFAVRETITDPWLGNVHLGPVLAVLYLGFLGTGVQYLLYQKSLKTMEAAQANLFIYLQPVVGVVLAALLVDEKITLSLLLGAVIVLIGARMALSTSKSTNINPID
jgi:drug/metabolite transporter (DMT)-like permease